MKPLWLVYSSRAFGEDSVGVIFKNGDGKSPVCRSMLESVCDSVIAGKTLPVLTGSALSTLREPLLPGIACTVYLLT